MRLRKSSSDTIRPIPCSTVILLTRPVFAVPDGGKKAYQHEMTRKDHILLAELLNDIQGMAIVSSYPSRLYDRLYVGWSLVTHPARSNGNRNMLEQLWISPNTRKRSKQQRLF